LSVFAHIFPESHPDIAGFAPAVAKMALETPNDAEIVKLLLDVASCLPDISAIFDLIPVNPETISLLSDISSRATCLQLTPAAFSARSDLFSLLITNDSLDIRRALFAILANLTRLNSGFALFKTQSVIDPSEYLAAQRLALIELRLQVDIPLNYKELEANERLKAGKNVVENTKDLLNPAMSASAGRLLELLMIPIMNHEDDLSDEQIEKYFDNANAMIHEVLAILKAVKGERDSQRSEIKLLLVILAKWLMDSPFLCQNKEVGENVKSLVQLLWWFPKEGLFFLPAFLEVVMAHGEGGFKGGGFSELGRRMKEHGDREEERMIDRLIDIVYRE
jgi:hypothetical protein